MFQRKKNKNIKKSYLIYIISSLIIFGSLFYALSYNSSYDELKNYIEKEDFESANLVLDKLDKFPIKVKSINEFRAVTILSTIDSLPEFTYYLKNSYQSYSDSLRVINNNKILDDIDLIKTNDFSLELEKLTLIANLLLNNIYSSTTSAIIKNEIYGAYWEKDNLKYSGYSVIRIFKDSQNINFDDYFKKYNYIGPDYSYYYKSQIDSIGELSAEEIYYESISNKKEVGEIIDDFQITEIKEKIRFRYIQGVNNSVSLIEVIDYVMSNYGLDDLKSFTPKKVDHEMLSLLNIIAITYPTIDNIKNFTGVDLSEENNVCCFKDEQDKMSSIIRSIVTNYEIKNYREREVFKSYGNGPYPEEMENIYSLLHKYLKEPFEKGDPSIIRSGNLFKLVSYRLFCDHCDLHILGNGSLAGYLQYSKSFHNKLNSRERRFAAALAKIVFLSSERFLSIDENDNIRYGIYNWYREYLEDKGDSSMALQVHNKLANLSDNNLNDYKAEILIDSYYSTGYGIKFERKDFYGSIVDFNKALDYLDFINHDNEANPKMFWEGISKAKILTMRGLAKISLDLRKNIKTKNSSGCEDLRLSSSLDSDYYNTYISFCLD